ncbi:hypothetical protein RKD37_001252 [Streptomyces ambofaciens]|uniref:hypothetical protein n=1 Tax=Streptomyces TaxID=1883 RepID=UPI00099DFDED|nr:MULTISPECIES: hypothetical protein [Streptomyces]MBU6531738.1 hypothetical protein [Streptomyces sp. A108]
MNATEWAEAQRSQAELDALTAQLADREAKKEHDLSAACDDCAVDCDQVPGPETDLARKPTPRHRPASRRRSRGR